MASAAIFAESPRLGWRFAFEACGVAGMLYALPLLLLLLLRNSPISEGETNHPKVSAWRAATALFTNVSFSLLVMYFTLPALAGWVIRDWMPAIHKERFDLGQGQAGVAATLSWQSAAIVGAIVGGSLADLWMRRSARGRLYVSAIGMTMIVPSIFGVGKAPTLWAAVAFLVVFGLGWGFFDCNNMPILSQIAPPYLRATGHGIMNFVVSAAAGWQTGASDKCATGKCRSM